MNFVHSVRVAIILVLTAASGNGLSISFGDVVPFELDGNVTARDSCPQSDVCTISSTAVGICTSSTYCDTRGGDVIGSCSNGSGGGEGVCCSLTLRATLQEPYVTVRDQVVVINGKPGTGLSHAAFEFPKLEGSCQLAVEFLEFSLQNPSASTGQCSEAMRISGSVTVRNYFPICGQNAGQKIFLSYGRSDRITLEFNTPSNGNYELRVTHLLCSDHEALAPLHCLQNYVRSTGVVRSLSYGNGMIAGHEYTIYIQDPSSSRAIEWLECKDGDPGVVTGVVSQFSLSNHFLQKVATTPEVRMGMTGFPCESTSFVEVYGEAKHCGGKFTIDTANGQIPVISRAKPFQLFVSTTPNAYALPPTVPPLTMVTFHYPPMAGPFNPPIPGCAALAGSTGAQGFHVCTEMAASHTCTCTLAAAGTIIESEVPPRTGFCLKYMLT